MLLQSRQVPPAGGVRYGRSIPSRKASAAGKPDLQHAAVPSRLASILASHGKIRTDRGDGNIVRVARAKKKTASIRVSRLGVSDAAGNTPGPGGGTNRDSLKLDRIQ